MGSRGTGLDESYLPSDLAGFVGPGGLEVQLDIVAIARHARPIVPTPAIPDASSPLRTHFRWNPFMRFPPVDVAMRG